MTTVAGDAPSLTRRAFLKPPVPTGLTALFRALDGYGGNVAAAGRVLAFSGYQWVVNSQHTQFTAGTNLFGDSTRNVWVDDLGRLHLRITCTAGRWHCAEVVNTAALGYGTYRWVLESPVDALDANVVLGLLTERDGPAFEHRGLGIVFARWGEPYAETARYAVPPHDGAGRHRTFWQPTGLRQSTHSFTWVSSSIEFQSAAGDVPAPLGPNDRRLYAGWGVGGAAGTPEPCGGRVRMKLWLDRGRAPSNRREVEVVIRSFDFSPG